MSDLEVPQKMPEIPAAWDRHRCGLGELEERLENFMSRLEPLCSPSEPQASTQGADKSNYCEFANGISEGTRAVERMLELLDSYNKRLEV